MDNRAKDLLSSSGYERSDVDQQDSESAMSLTANHLVLIKTVEVVLLVYAFGALLEFAPSLPSWLALASATFVGTLVCYWIPPAGRQKLSVARWLLISVGLAFLRGLLSYVLATLR